MIALQEVRPAVPAPVVDRKGTEVRIAEADFPKPFHIGLQYSSPARGTWTIAHSPMLIPECHEIYVCCACCLHGVVLSADEIPGGSDRFSMVTVTNENILRGDLETMMIDGVSAILEEMPVRPKCVEAFTSCIQHFLHIDIKYVYRKLRERFPDIAFIDGYMIPTLQRSFSPDVLGRRQLTRAIPDRPQKKAVNILVNYYPVDPESELVQMFRNGGYTVRDFAACATWEDYLAMGEAGVNLYFLKEAKPAAEDLARRLHRQSCYVPYAYLPERIRAQMTRLSEKFSLPLPDLDRLESEMEAKFERLRAAAGSTPVAIDYTATPKPLELARFLLERNFDVYVVYTDGLSEEEKEDFLWLQEHAPDLLLRPTQHYKMRLLPRDDVERKERILAIGQKAAFFTGTDRFVNIIENGSLTGFSGLMSLAGQMEEALHNPKNVREIIQVKAWGCKG